MWSFLTLLISLSAPPVLATSPEYCRQGVTPLAFTTAQQEVLEPVVEWVGRWGTLPDLKQMETELGLGRVGKRFFGAFGGWEAQAWLAAKKYGASLRIDVPLRKVYWRSPPPDEFREAVRNEILHLAIRTSLKNGRPFTEAQQISELVGVRPARLFGLNIYSATGTQYEYRIFDDTTSWWLSYRDALANQGMRFRLYDVTVRGKTPESWTVALQNEVTMAVLDRRILDPDFEITHESIKALGFGSDRVFGLGDYKTRFRHRSIFRSREDLAAQLARVKQLTSDQQLRLIAKELDLVIDPTVEAHRSTGQGYLDLRWKAVGALIEAARTFDPGGDIDFDRYALQRIRKALRLSDDLQRRRP